MRPLHWPKTMVIGNIIARLEGQSYYNNTSQPMLVCVLDPPLINFKTSNKERIIPHRI